MALRPRQIRFYQEVCSIYRKVKGATNDQYRLVASGVPCKLYTTPNVDVKAPVSQIKQSNIFTDNKLHVDAAQDIKAEDVIEMTTSLNVGVLPWFRVHGEPQTRQGVANRSMVYLVPQAALQESQIAA